MAKNKTAQSRPDQKMIDRKLARQARAKQIYEKGMLGIRDIIAPSSFEIESNHIRLGKVMIRTIFIFGYPRSLFTGWLSPIINLDEIVDISLNIVPVETKVVLTNLKKKVAQLEASYNINREKGRVRDPQLEASIQDAEELRDRLQIGVIGAIE